MWRLTPPKPRSCRARQRESAGTDTSFRVITLGHKMVCCRLSRAFPGKEIPMNYWVTWSSRAVFQSVFFCRRGRRRQSTQDGLQKAIPRAGTGGMIGLRAGTRRDSPSSKTIRLPGSRFFRATSPLFLLLVARRRLYRGRRAGQRRRAGTAFSARPWKIGGSYGG